MSYTTNPAQPTLPCALSATCTGGCTICHGKREEIAPRTTVHPFNTHVGSASSETSWKIQSPELCKYCYSQKEVLARGTTAEKTNPNPSLPTVCSAPGAYSGVRIHPLSRHHFPCMPSPLITNPASKGLGPLSPSPHLEDVFL